MMKKILLHTIKKETIGGTTTVISDIVNSYMKEKYLFKHLYQEEACGLNPFKAFLFVNKYRKKINRENADVIYVCGLLYSGFLLTIAAKLSNIKKIIVSVHGSEWDKKGQPLYRKLLFGYLIEPLTVYLADEVFTVCAKGLENTAIKRGGHGNIYGVIYNQIPQVKFEDYPEGVFRTSLNVPKDKILVAVVGRVVEDKGHRYIIDALQKLNDDRYIFVIVGDGPSLDNYRKECSDLLEKKRLFLLGIRNDVLQILRDCDIFLFATLRENHSKSLLEAVCMRCAVICTDVGGNPEIIDAGETGIMIPPKNSEAIIKSLRILGNRELRIKYSEEAFKRVSHRYSIDNTLGKLDKLFEEI